MAQALKQRHQRYLFHSPTLNLSARPNVDKRSSEARETTDTFLLAAAGVDRDEEEQKAKRNRTWQYAAVILAAVGLLVAALVL